MTNIIQFPGHASRQNPGLGVPKDSQSHSGSSALALKSDLDAPVPQSKPTNPGLGVPKDKESQNYRPTLKVRLGAGDRPVIDITQSWTAKKSCAANVGTAIRFYNAYLVGDLDAMRKECPLIVSMFAAGALPSKKLVRAPSIKESSLIEDSLIEDQNQDQEGTATCKALAAKITEVTLTDYLVNKRKVDGTARKLHAAGYTADSVQDWYERYWCVIDWRGNGSGKSGKPERPTLENVRTLIGQVKAMSPTADPYEVAANRYRADPYFQRADIDNDAPLVEVEPKLPPRQIEPPGVRKMDRWRALMGQTQLQLNRPTFDLWLSHIELIGSVGNTWIIETPNAGNTDWLERHLLPALEKSLDGIMRWDGPSVTLKVVTRGDDQFRTVSLPLSRTNQQKG